MPRIFGRDAPSNHALEAKLTPLDTVGSSERFIAHNWRHDWRVFEPREQQVVGHIAGMQGDPALKSCYDQYHRECICAGCPPEYRQVCNDRNLLPGIVRDSWLARVVPLDHFKKAAGEQLPEVRAVPTWDAWLEDTIGRARQRGFIGLREFLARLFHAWNNWSEHDQRPAWASFWADVEPLLAASTWPDRVRDALGLGKVPANKWLIVLRYRVKDVPCCIRPTCLDADWVPWHFPSPPAETTGITMDLDSGNIGMCCPEVIHQPIALNIEHWLGHMGKTSRTPNEHDMADLRRRHHERLRSRFGDALGEWMASPV